MSTHAPDVQTANIHAMLTELDDTIDLLRRETHHSIILIKAALHSLHETIRELIELPECKAGE